MVIIKSEDEIRIMKEGGRKLKQIVDQLVKLVKPGIMTKEIDRQAEKLILAAGGKPSFKEVKGYFWSTCLSVNEQVVHTPPSDRILKNGDVLTIDIGIKYKGFHTDYADSLIVGESKDEKLKDFLKTGEETLEQAIQKAKTGNYLGDISKAIQDNTYKHKYYILKGLTGHGIGRNLHEDPMVLGFLDKPIDKTLKLVPGITLAIEVIYSMGTEEINYEKGADWSIVTKDRSLSACFEKTIGILPMETSVLT